MRLFTLFFLIGTVLIQLGDYLPSILWLSVTLCFLLLIALLMSSFYQERFIPKRTKLNNLMIIPIAVFSGLLVSTSVAEKQIGLRLADQFEGKDIILQGRISNIPKIREDGIRFRLDIRKAFWPEDLDPDMQKEIQKKEVAVKGIVRLGWFKNTQTINAGEVWQFRVRLKKPSGFMNPNGFDYEKWLFTERINATGYVRAKKGAPLKQNKRLAASPWWSVNYLRQQLHQKIQILVADKSSAAVISALVVAVRSELADEQWTLLQQTGTSHLIAISGLHISVVAGFAFLPIFLLWRLFPRLNERIPVRVAGGVAGVVMATAYAMLAGFTLPTQRALLMVLIALLGLISRRNFHASTILATAALAVLILDPLAPMTASFWLSFIAVSLILIYIKRQIKKPKHQLISLQLVLSFGMLPLTLFFFNSASLTSPIANILAIPWVSLIVVPLSLLGAIVSPISEFFSGAFLNIASLAVQYLFTFLSFLSDLSFGSVSLAQIPSIYLLMAFLGLLYLLFPKGFPAKWLGFIAFLPAILFTVEKPQQNEFNYTLLDAGQGMASVVQTENHTLIYDTGTRFSKTYDIGKLVLNPYLKSKGIRHIDTMILSHEDIDHRGGAEVVLKENIVDKIVSSDTSILQDYKVETCVKGENWQWDGVRFEILSPPQDYPENDNNRSCVLRISNQYHSLILTADIQTKTEKLLLENVPEKLKSDVLSVPHHGSRTSSSKRFIREVSPKIALVPVGYRNRFGHPKADIMQRYHDKGIEVFNTAKQGAIELYFPNSDKEILVKTYRKEKRGFWSR